MNFLKGRTNRSTYWVSVAVIVVLMAILTVIAPNNARLSEVVLVILCVPRLHDVGRSGWWMAVALALEIVAGVLIGVRLSGEDAEVALGAVSLVFYIALIVLGCIPGQPTQNRFGEPPRPGVRWGKAPARP